MSDFFFPIVPHAEAPYLALETRIPLAKWQAENRATWLLSWRAVQALRMTPQSKMAAASCLQRHSDLPCGSSALATRLREPHENPAPYPHCGERHKAALGAAFPTLKRLCSGARVRKCPLSILQSAVRAFHSFWSELSLLILDPRTQAEGPFLETDSGGSITKVLDWIKKGKKKCWSSTDF